MFQSNLINILTATNKNFLFDESKKYRLHKPKEHQPAPPQKDKRHLIVVLQHSRAPNERFALRTGQLPRCPLVKRSAGSPIERDVVAARGRMNSRREKTIMMDDPFSSPRGCNFAPSRGRKKKSITARSPRRERAMIHAMIRSAPTGIGDEPREGVELRDLSR